MHSQAICILIGKPSLRCKLLAVAAAFFFASALPGVAQQQGSATQQNIQLKDPTPRPPDLQKIYGNSPADQAKQQEAAALKNAQIRQQVVDASNKLSQLAQQLRDDVSASGRDSRSSANAAKAAQIEKLAKAVREKTRQQ
jgi:hypothetical protein